VFEAVEDRHALVDAVANEASAPDVLLRPAGMQWKVSDVVRERVFGETDEFSHTWTGLVVAAGPSVAGEFAVESPSVVDIAPTVLRLFGIDPSGLDGRPLLTGATKLEPRADAASERRFLGGASTSEGVATNATEESDDGGDGDDYDVVADRLKQMGYLD
jgi:arylsulfatase A-like enzyme